jgi:RNA polymerase sigma factor (sigma-70 family)
LRFHILGIIFVKLVFTISKQLFCRSYFFANICSTTSLKQNSTFTEEELVPALRQKSQEAFRYLYLNYRMAVLNVVLQFVADKIEAEDIVQEVFVAVWRNIDKYDASRGRLFTWLHTLSRNTAINHLRSKQFKKSLKNESLTDVVSIEDNLKVAANNINHIGLRKHIQQLKPEWSKVLELSYFVGLTHEEIAAALNMPVGTVKTRLRSGLAELRKFFSA